MNIYPPIPKKSSSTHSYRCDAFARQAVFEEIRPRDAHALDQSKFHDRAPDEKPIRLDHVADSVVRQTAVKAIRHCEREASLALTSEDRDRAMETARRIARCAGIRWVDPDREAA